MRVIFQKTGKIFENLGKNVQNLKIIWKGAGDCVRLSHAKKLLEWALMLSNQLFISQNIENAEWCFLMSFVLERGQGHSVKIFAPIATQHICNITMVNNEHIYIPDQCIKLKKKRFDHQPNLPTLLAIHFPRFSR